jgi:glutathione S-transferase
MNQWISAVNSYYYYYMIYHVTHERLVFPELGIAGDEKVVAHALPKIETGLAVIERELSHGKHFLVGDEPTIADFYLLPSTFAFSLTPEGNRCIRSIRRSAAGGSEWKACRRSETVRAAVPASRSSTREWATSHRPKY